MGFSISFLDGDGKLVCLLVAEFSDQTRAAHYARDVMKIRGCRRQFQKAEICGAHSSSLLTVSAQAPDMKVLSFERAAKKAVAIQASALRL